MKSILYLLRSRDQTIEEKLPQLTKAKVFTFLDVSEAYYTIVMNEEYCLLTTFQRPNDRFCYTCTPFLVGGFNRLSIKWSLDESTLINIGGKT